VFFRDSSSFQNGDFSARWILFPPAKGHYVMNPPMSAGSALNSSPEAFMSYGFLETAFTPGVRAVQEQMGVADFWEGIDGSHGSDTFSENEVMFIGQRDSFYMATVSETGWPYMQHRGGPAGFLKVLDETTLAFADYRGNRQYVSTGNLAANDRACLFLMDYARRARLKIFVHVETLAPDADPELAKTVAVPGYRAKIERIFRLRLEGYDWNCPQHITARYTVQDIKQMAQPLQERLAELEAENAKLRARLGEPPKDD
jgi:predicted pyridoxine 5'-phosphate oxidase superfamily flavin-nucleotide-binding protein